MGYIYELNNYYKIKCVDGEEKKEYPWPCKDNPKRTVDIYNDDILVINSEENGICSVIKHTGLAAIGILIPKDDLKEYHDTIQLGVNL
jgi:hypothetical protein